MDNNESNDSDNIVWRFIDKENNKILIISEYCLWCQDTYGGDYPNWENSNSREYLNNELYNTAFSSDEKAKIQSSHVTNNGSEEHKIDGGNDTVDKVFLLSISEANEYFSDDNNRIAYGTLSAQDENGNGKHAFDWWLRSPGIYSEGFSSRLKQSYVSDKGYVNDEGTTGDCYNLGIRPVIGFAGIIEKGYPNGYPFSIVPVTCFVCEKHVSSR